MSLKNIDLREEQKQETEKKQYLEYYPKIVDIINIFRTK